MGLDPVQMLLVAIAGIFVIGIVGEWVFERTGVPDVVWLIGVGILLGPVTRVVDHENLLRIAPFFGAIALILILFDGGLGLQLEELRRVLGRACLLAGLTFVLATLVLAAISVAAARAGLLPSGWTWGHGLLLGATLGGSSSAVIMPSMQKAGAPAGVTSLVNMESALTDVLCVVGAGTILEVLAAGTADTAGVALGLAQYLLVGLIVGIGAGILASYGLRRLVRTDRAYPVVVSGLLVLYVLVDTMGGCAALAIFAVAVAVRNAPALAVDASAAERLWLHGRVTHVHGQLAFMAKSFFFTLIGTLLAPPWPLLALGAGIGVVLLLARWPAALLALRGAGFSPAERSLVVACLPRGLAAGVLSLAPAAAGVAASEEFPVVVFAAIVTSIVLFAGTFAAAKRRLAAEAVPAGAPAVSAGSGVARRVLP